MRNNLHIIWAVSVCSKAYDCCCRFAFIEFDSESDLKAAISEHNGEDVDGRQIHLELKGEKKPYERNSFGGGGGGGGEGKFVIIYGAQVIGQHFSMIILLYYRHFLAL